MTWICFFRIADPCEGNLPGVVNFFTKGRQCISLLFSLLLVWISCSESNLKSLLISGSVTLTWRHCRCNEIVSMEYISPTRIMHLYILNRTLKLKWMWHDVINANCSETQKENVFGLDYLALISHNSPHHWPFVRLLYWSPMDSFHKRQVIWEVVLC